MDFSLTTLFVVPVGNTLPSSGSIEDLTPGQFGIFRNDYTVATAGNIAAAPYFYIFQGRTAQPNLGPKGSDKIHTSKKIEWYKTTGSPTINNQITEVSDFAVGCGEDITVTFRLHSKTIEDGFFNGLTRSVVVKTACCDCGADPCTEIDPEATVDAIVAKARLDTYLNKYLSFERSGTGADSILRVSGKVLDKFGNPCDIAAFPFEYDRLWFRVFVTEGPETTSDFIVDDRCDQIAVVTVTQRASYPMGTSDEIKQLEKNFFSYQTDHKHLFRDSGYNGAFESYVTDGTIYDTFVIKFFEYDQLNTWASNVQQDETVIIAAPQAVSAGILTVLTAGLGTPKDTTTTQTTTTTTTSTTSTTTTSTTTLIP